MARYGIRGYKINQNKVSLWHALQIRVLRWVNVKKSESKQNWLEERRKRKKRTVVKKDSVRVSQTKPNHTTKERKRKHWNWERVSSNDELVQIIGGHDPSPLHCGPPTQDSHHEILCWYIICFCSIASSFSFSLCLYKSMWLDFVVLVCCLFGSNYCYSK